MNPFAPGSRVVIAFNPHHEDASDVVGTVVKFEPGTGFMACDLATIRYVRPLDGSRHELPFATYNLEVGGRESLLARAKRHEEQAQTLRAMADEVSR